MKAIFTIFTFLCFCINCSAQWITQSTGNVNASTFTDVYAITPEIVIVTGDNGTILKTNNGGVTWQQISSGTNQNLGKIQFPTPTIGYVVSTGAQLLKTTDGGDSWLPIAVDNISSIYSLSCVNENLIFLSCQDANSNSVLLKSTNGGVSWEKLTGNDSQTKFYDIQFFSADTGYTAGNYTPDSYTNKILKTQDGGKNWVEIENSLSPFNFVNQNQGFYYQNGFLKTSDGGNNFVKLGEGSIHGISKIFSIDENTAWGVLEEQTLCGCGKRGLVRMTYDSENGYKEYIQNLDAYISSIYFSSEKLGYAVGKENGKASIWKNTAADLTLNTKENELKKSINVFPNPTSDKIHISMNNQLSDEMTIAISDMTGKLIHQQNFNNKKELTIDVRHFIKGNYILTVKNQSQSYSQKIIIK